MTDEEIVELGLRAEALLNSATFKHVVRYLSDSYIDNILATTYDDTKAREKNYHLHHALQDLVGQLGAYTEAAHKLINEGQRDEDKGLEEDEQD